MVRLLFVCAAALLLRPVPDDGCIAHCSDCVPDCMEGCEQRCRGDCSESCARSCARGCSRCVEFCRAWLRPQRGEPARPLKSPKRRGDGRR